VRSTGGGIWRDIERADHPHAVFVPSQPKASERMVSVVMNVLWRSNRQLHL
jgi:hypothetical protein